jgi:hypothetical protein
MNQGFNVTFSAWPRSSLTIQASTPRLLNFQAHHRPNHIPHRKTNHQPYSHQAGTLAITLSRLQQHHHTSKRRTDHDEICRASEPKPKRAKPKLANQATARK